MKLLHVIGTLNPSFGGPAEALKQLVSALSDLGFNNEIVTLDKGNTYFSNDKGIVVHALGPSIGKYRFNLRLIPWLLINAKRFDVVICNAIWQYQCFAIWLASRFVKFPYFVFVHGALDPWFRYAYPLKHIKKWLYWPWGVYNVLRAAKAVLYTSEDEKLLAPKSFCLYKANGVVVNLGICAPIGEPNLQKETFYEIYPTLRGKHILLFLSRIHPKKGCDILIEAFAKVAEKDPLLHLVIAGSDETNWVPLLKSQAQKLKIAERITWTGFLQGNLKWGALNAASCFVLPSHSENFGIVVAETLACGIPVIITDKVNIWREIQNEEAGFVGQDTLVGTMNSLRQWLELSDIEKEKMRENAKKCFFKYFEINSSAKNFIKTIQSELNR
ncbi:MAG: glycosyltransferase [Anaerolineaceae bacterium]|jgi:glycosyltransferase involved in cell wall biosynthesis|nr:MAG: glycosyltransferase [Anaerolineaceae bacterium]